MAVYTWQLCGPSGRIAGSFVYLLLCRDEERIYVKVGQSIQPEKRFHSLKNGCPVTPRSFSVIPVPGKAIAKNLEQDLHERFSKWRVAGEWFAMTVEDKREFNDKLHASLRKNSMPSWALEITKVSAKYLVELAKKRQLYWQTKYRRAGMAYKDFLKDSA